MSLKYRPSNKASKLMLEAIKKHKKNLPNLIKELDKIRKEDITNYLFNPKPHVSHGRYKE